MIMKKLKTKDYAETVYEGRPCLLFPPLFIFIFTLLEILKIYVYVYSNFKILTTLFYSTKDLMPRARTPPMFMISRICFDRYKLAVCFIYGRPAPAQMHGHTCIKCPFWRPQYLGCSHFVVGPSSNH